MRTRHWLAALALGAALVGVGAPARASSNPPPPSSSQHPAQSVPLAAVAPKLHIVCAREGGNGRHFVSFYYGTPVKRPWKATVHVWALSADDGWVELGRQWVQPGTLVTSIWNPQVEHGTISAMRITLGERTSQTVPLEYHEDCSYAGFPAA